MIYNEIATVLTNNKIADNIYQAYLVSPKISQESKPGQFINILPNKNWTNVMRRPMSIASQEDGKISIIYKVFGKGTEIISQWKENDKVDIIGPLGNFWNGYKDSNPILIGGGVGIAPIINLKNHLDNLSINHDMIMGAQIQSEHFLPHNPEKGIYMSTNDGSLGVKGTVIDVLKILIPKTSNRKIFACGPPGMMEAVKDFANSNDIACDLALETIMACGFGICQGCTVEKAHENNCKHSYREKYALVCIDGPIFNSKDIKTCYL